MRQVTLSSQVKTEYYSWARQGLQRQKRPGLGFRTFPADSDPAWTEGRRGGGGWRGGPRSAGHEGWLLLSSLPTSGDSADTTGGPGLRHSGASPAAQITLGGTFQRRSEYYREGVGSSKQKP